MVDSVVRQIKLPGKGIVNIKVPGDWTPERLKQELIDRGELRPTEAQPAPTGGLLSSLADIPGSIAKGLERGTEETLQTIGDFRKEIYDRFPSLLKFSIHGPAKARQLTEKLRGLDLPEQGHEPTTGTGEFAKAAAQFVPGVLASPIKGRSLAASLAEGSIADFLAFDPEESKTLATELNKSPWLDPFIWDGLVSDPDDSSWEGKLKNAMEGGAIGATVHKVLQLVKAGKDAIAARMVKEVPPEQLPPELLKLPAPQREIQVDSKGQASASPAPNTTRAEGQAAQLQARRDSVGVGRNEADAAAAARQVEISRQADFDAIQSQEARIKQQQIEDTYAHRDAVRKAEAEADRLDNLAKNSVINPQNKLKFGGKQSGQVDPAVFREGIKAMYSKAKNFFDFTKEGKKQFGAEFEPVAEAMYRSVRAEEGDIPATASPRERVGGYNPNKINTSEEVKQYTDELIHKYGESKEVQSWASVKAKANDLGMSREQIIRLRNESKNWTARVKAAHDASLDSWEATQKHAIKAVDGTPEDLKVFYTKMLEDAEMLNSIVGIRSESGRLLNSLKMLSESRGDITEAFAKHLEKSGGMESLRSIAQKVAEASTTAEGRKITRKAIKEPTLFDAVLEYWINWGLLSGPQTHAVNFLSNGLTQGLNIAEQFGTSAVGAVLRSSDRQSFAQSAKYALAYKQAGLDAMRAAGKTFSSDDAIIVAGNREIQDELGKFELDAHKAWRASTFTRYIPNSISKNLPQSTKDKISKWTDKSGEAVRTPGKALYVGDAFWKTFAYRAKLNQLAIDEIEKMTKAGKITKDDVAATYQGFIDNPTGKMHKAALEHARYVTYTNELGQFGKLLQSAASAAPVVKFAMPFIRTPLNIFKYSIERTPLGLAMSPVRDALRAGGRARDEALAKMLIGSSIGATAWEMAAGGVMTGGAPKDPQSRANFYESGKVPYSVKVGDSWVSIARMEPIATVMGMAAMSQQVFDHMTKGEQDQVAASLAVAMGDLVANKTYMESLGNIIQAISEPDRYGGKWLERTIGSFAVPNLAAQIARDMDPHIKNIETITDAVKQRIPGYREEVVNRLNRWGEPLEYGGNMLNPFWDSKATDSKFLQSMYKNDIQVGMPSDTIDGVKLSPRLYNQYVQFGRIPARRQLEQMYNTSAIGLQSPEIQAKIVKDVVRKWDNFAKKRMTPIIFKEMMDFKIQKAKALATPEKERIKIEAE